MNFDDEDRAFLARVLQPYANLKPCLLGCAQHKKNEEYAKRAQRLIKMITWRPR